MSKNSWAQAKAQYEAIELLLEACDDADENGETTLLVEDGYSDGPIDADQVLTFCYENVLDAARKGDEYEILLCTGGPAVQLVGPVDEYGIPFFAQLVHSDWGESWQTWPALKAQADILLRYARLFYFGA